LDTVFRRPWRWVPLSSPGPANFQERAVPHRLSLVRRLALLRRLYTGETDSSLMPVVTTACQRMVAEERQLLLQTLNRDYSQRLLGDDNAAPLPPALRAALLPDADTRPQQELEAAVLLAASRSAGYLHPWPGIAHWLTTRPSQLVRMVRPQPKSELVLHLDAITLAPLLLELLPRMTAEDAVAGLPGLRATLHRRHIELVWFGTDAPTRIQLANVSYRAWSAALAFAEAAYPEPDPLRWLGNDPTPLLPQELEALADRRLSGELTALASWLLRRLKLLGQAQRLHVSAPKPDQLQVRWSGGSTAAAVATKLVHPIMGFSGDKFAAVPAGSSVTIHCLDSDVSLELRPTPSGEVALAPPVVDVARAWRAWEERLCARSQWSDQFWAKQGIKEPPPALAEPVMTGGSSDSEPSRPMAVDRAE
jgi:hypothetical protein